MEKKNQIDKISLSSAESMQRMVKVNNITIFTLSILYLDTLIPYHTWSKISAILFYLLPINVYYLLCVLVANSLDPDLGVHCLLRSVCLSTL